MSSSLQSPHRLPFRTWKCPLRFQLRRRVRDRVKGWVRSSVEDRVAEIIVVGVGEGLVWGEAKSRVFEEINR